MLIITLSYKSDSFETRNELFDCLEEYEELELLHSNTLSHFHFVDEEVKNTLGKFKKININK